MEAEILAAEGLAPDDLRASRLRIKGARRPLRFPLEAGAVQLADDEHGAYLSMQFVLPRGCYATTVTRELLDAKPMADDSPAE
jgi:tRNA(Glu) U13 pseudouridine synthase TruD